MVRSQTRLGMLVTMTLVMTLASVVEAQEKPPKVRLEQVARGLDKPLWLTHAGTDRWYVLEQPGRIRIMQKGQLTRRPFLDLTKKVHFGGECGLLGMALHPKFSENGRFFVNYTTRQAGKLQTFVSEFTTSPNAPAADASSERVVIAIEQPWGNHNGGGIEFGPDGMLYIGMGDGGAANDPKNAGQDPTTLLGKMLRIDVDRRDGQLGYAVPSDNPFVGQSRWRPEIWALGLRNPWRFSFDPKTGELWAGDVGQNAWEEISIITRGGNYGWRPFEGTHRTRGISRDEQPISEHIPPVKEYPQTNNNRSVTGGYVYRGSRIPALVGWYVYGDYASGRVWGLKRDEAGKVVGDELLLETKTLPSSFAVDHEGELLLIDHNGSIHRIVD